MSVCRHEMGGSTPQPLFPAIPTLGLPPAISAALHVTTFKARGTESGVCGATRRMRLKNPCSAATLAVARGLILL